MEELQELIEYARRNLAEAKARGDALNVHFYSNVLELYEGETGPGWGIILKYMREGNNEQH